MYEITKKTVDGREVAVISEFKELTYDVVLMEMERLTSNMNSIKRQASVLQDNYNTLKQQYDFYKEELKLLEPQTKSLSDILQDEEEV